MHSFKMKKTHMYVHTYIPVMVLAFLHLSDK